MTDLLNAMKEQERLRGLPYGYLSRVARVESNMNPSAKNPGSSAGGLFQFIDSTARQYGLENRYDPMQATDAVARLAQDNKAALARALGREPTDGELYLAHQQGAGGATRLLANPSGLAVDTLRRRAVLQNGGSPEMTNQQFASTQMSKMEEAGAGTQSGFTRTGPFAVPNAAAQPSPPAEAGYKVPDFSSRHSALDARNIIAQRAPGRNRSHVDGLTDTKALRLAAFLQDNPHGVELGSGARSMERQQQLWDAAVQKYGSAEAARKWVAPPGRSQHNHGNAADLRYKTAEAQKWAHENAAKYGLTFPMGHEPWHVETIEARKGGPKAVAAAAKQRQAAQDPGLYAEAPPQSMGLPEQKGQPVTLPPNPRTTPQQQQVARGAIAGPNGETWHPQMMRDPAGGGEMVGYGLKEKPTGIAEGFSRDAQLNEAYEKLFGSNAGSGGGLLARLFGGGA